MQVKDILLSCRRDKLINLAERNLKYIFIGDINTLTDEEKYYLSDEYKRKVFTEYSKEDLVEVVLTKPTVVLEKSPQNTIYRTVRYEQHPLGNLVFTRDQQIVTSKGVILGNLNSLQRQEEIEIMKLCFELLQIPIIGEIKEPGKLEGGDFFPLGDIAFIGVGLRSNYNAVNYMLNNDLFGTQRVIVVEDNNDKNQDRMHLDTIFNIVDGKTVVLLETIIPPSPIQRTVSEFVRRENIENECAVITPMDNSVNMVDTCKYYYKKRELEFTQFLRGENFTIIPITESQQQEYMINFLNLGKGKAIISVHRGLENVLLEKGIKANVKYIEYDAMKCLYGAAHCTTQVFRNSS